MILSEEYIEFLRKAAETYKATTVPDQIIKLVEEVGELAEAWVGVRGSNPRKGITHTFDDLGAEAADVVLSALVLMMKIGGDPNVLLEAQQTKAEGYRNASA